MSKGRYLTLLLVFAIGLPAFIGFVSARGRGGPAPSAEPLATVE
jgi:hypothetical protein